MDYSTNLYNITKHIHCIQVYIIYVYQWENEQTFTFFGNPIHHLVYLDYITVYYLPSAITIFLHYTVTTPHQMKNKRAHNRTTALRVEYAMCIWLDL